MVAFTNAAINKITKLMGAFEKHRSVDTQEVKPRNLAETVEGERGGGVLIVIHSHSRMTIDRPSHPDNSGTDHVGLSPTRLTLLAPSQKRGDV